MLCRAGEGRVEKPGPETDMDGASLTAMVGMLGIELLLDEANSGSSGSTMLGTCGSSSSGRQIVGIGGFCIGSSSGRLIMGTGGLEDERSVSGTLIVGTAGLLGSWALCFGGSNRGMEFL